MAEEQELKEIITRDREMKIYILLNNSLKPELFTITESNKLVLKSY